MKMLMCAVYDKGIEAYMQPFFVRHKSEAIRSFADAVGKADTPFCTHPEDFTLFVLGEYDDNTGAIVPLSVTEKVITAMECRAVSSA